MLVKTNRNSKNRRYLIMPYIYKITNKINNKLYIGKTMLSIEKRWQEHLRDYNKESKAKSLYIQQ
jgi:hypothetical protein